MECVEIKALLSEFIDGTLDVQTKAAVEMHVSTCRDCEAELTSLSAVVEELRALDPIEAPEDFLEKIHERMAPRHGFSKIVRKLFFPLHIKVPLELAGAATMALLVLLVLNVQHTEKDLFQGPEVSTYKMDVEMDAAGRAKSEGKPEAKESRPVLKSAPAGQSDTEDLRVARKAVEKPVKPKSRANFELTPSALQQMKAVQPAMEHKSIELELVLKTKTDESTDELSVPKEAAQPLDEGVSVGGEETGYMASSGIKVMGRQGEPVAEMNKDQPVEEKPAILLPGRERALLKDESGSPVSFRENPLKTVKHLVERIEGNVVSVEHDRAAELKFIHAEIPAIHYESFCSELGRMADLQKPPLPPFAKGLETIRIRIRFISTE